MTEPNLLHKALSTIRLEKLLNQCSEEEIHELAQFAYKKNCDPVNVKILFGKILIEKILIEKIQYNSSNDLFFRLGVERPDYLDIVRKAAKRLKIKYSPDDDEEALEEQLLHEFIKRVLAKASPEERKNIAALIEKEKNKPEYLLLVSTWVAKVVLPQAAGMVVQGIGKQLITRLGIGAIGGPFALVLATGLSVATIASQVMGPAYRKIIPSTLYISYLRQKRKVDILNGGEV